MGKAIEKVAQGSGHEICCRIESQEDYSTLSEATLDVAIEFTQPEAAFENISFSTFSNS